DPDEELVNLAADLNAPAMRLWIVAHGDTDFAFLQDYAIHAWADHPYRDLPPGALGVDQSIGIAAMLERGHGSAFIRYHTDMLLKAGAPCIVTDPDPDNARAIRACEKAGFRLLENGLRITEWGCSLL